MSPNTRRTSITCIVCVPRVDTVEGNMDFFIVTFNTWNAYNTRYKCSPCVLRHLIPVSTTTTNRILQTIY